MLLSFILSYLLFTILREGVQVYVFDTGVNAEHPDFQGRVTRDANFIEYEDDNDESGHGKDIKLYQEQKKTVVPFFFFYLQLT